MTRIAGIKYGGCLRLMHLYEAILATGLPLSNWHSSVHFIRLLFNQHSANCRRCKLFICFWLDKLDFFAEFQNNSFLFNQRCPQKVTHKKFRYKKLITETITMVWLHFVGLRLLPHTSYWIITEKYHGWKVPSFMRFIPSIKSDRILLPGVVIAWLTDFNRSLRNWKATTKQQRSKRSFECLETEEKSSPDSVSFQRWLHHSTYRWQVAWRVTCHWTTS